jgi:hypothetical protein
MTLGGQGTDSRLCFDALRPIVDAGGEVSEPLSSAIRASTEPCKPLSLRTLQCRTKIRRRSTDSDSVLRTKRHVALLACGPTGE